MELLNTEDVIMGSENVEIEFDSEDSGESF